VQRVDDLLNREIESRGLELAPAAERRTLLRRLTYDLTGLPPTHEEVEAFVADDSPDPLSKVIERLLDSPQYGVHWGRRWLDVVRYADSSGTTSDHPLPHAWRYRNWVMEAFQKDMPFDQFVRLQLAGDVSTDNVDPEKHAEGIVATGYLALARRFGFDSDRDMFLTYEDTIDNIGKSFLGLTLACARCHDHKYDAVTAEDYYALYGILESSRFSFPGCEKNGQPRDLVPLLPQTEIDELMKLWQAKNAPLEIAKKEQIEAAKSASESLKKFDSASSIVVAESEIAEGASVPFEHRLHVRKGEVVQLAVSPNASHGADTTQIEWRIAETGGVKRSWSLAELVPDLMKGNPYLARDGAVWCFLETTTTPVFLTEQHNSIDGNSSLKSWRVGDRPSVTVNASDQQVRVWTTLAAKSFFVHPGPERSVGVAWISPLDGEIILTGRVADVHPANFDGVTFELKHIAAPEYGPAIVKLGESMKPIPSPEPLPVIPVAYAVVDREKPANTRFQQRGEPENLGPEVPRRWLTAFGGTEVRADAGSGRRELGDWISHHPLTARVMVNRIWQWHFGNGLVRTPNDFGARGDAPTHPELLEFLAARFVQSGYSVKALHRLILKTEAYQRASATPVEADPDNRFLAHFNRRRLTAEELRDSVMLASGRLDMTPGTTHPFPAENTWRFSQHGPFNAVYETDKRSAFMMVQRQRRHPYLALFDGADPNASTAGRRTTTVPTQALYFINDPLFHAHAAKLAESVQEEPIKEVRLQALYRKLFQRLPTPAEYERANKFLNDYPGEESETWSALARILLASNEFTHVD